jgi:hypothetical protein
MTSILNNCYRQDILFVCGMNRVVNAETIIADIANRQLMQQRKVVCFAESGKPRLDVNERLLATRLEANASTTVFVRNCDIAIFEGLPCVLSHVVPTIWRAKCDVVGEILSETIEDAFSQIRIHFLKHWYGDTAKRAERIRVFFDGHDVTTEFRAHEDRTRLRYSPMNTEVANPGSRDNYYM